MWDGYDDGIMIILLNIIDVVVVCCGIELPATGHNNFCDDFFLYLQYNMHISRYKAFSATDDRKLTHEIFSEQ